MQKPIVIFDSGVGGLTIFREVTEKLPHLPVIYCYDNEGFPYGLKPEETVVERTLHCLSQLTKRVQPSLAVIACNTASTISLPKARNRLNIPIIGVVPAIKPAAIATKKSCIGLLATPATVDRAYTRQLIRDFAPHCEVVRVGSSDLVDCAEQALRSEKIDLEKIQKTISPFFDRKVTPDCIVLGCTHFPLLKDALDRAVPESVTWVDSGEAIARRVSDLLKAQPRSEKKPDHRFVYTGCEHTVEGLKPTLVKMGFNGIETL